MAGIYVYSDNSKLAAELLSFAKQTGQRTYAFAFSQEEAESIQNSGADKVYLIKGNSPVIENYGKAISEFLKKEGGGLLAVGTTPRGRDIAARIAGYLDCGMVSDILSVSYKDEKVIADKMMYGGSTIQQVVTEGLSVITIPAGKFETLVSSPSTIETIFLEADSRVTLVESTAIKKEGADLSAAEKIVCIGLGMEKQEDIKIAQDLADVLGAEIGCTRNIAEERKWLPIEQYIGISGASVKPQLYLAMGVSGQVQHVVGMREAKIIVAVNTNEKAPIFEAADYGIVGDMYEIIPLLTEALKNS